MHEHIVEDREIRVMTIKKVRSADRKKKENLKDSYLAMRERQMKQQKRLIDKITSGSLRIKTSVFLYGVKVSSTRLESIDKNRAIYLLYIFACMLI